MQRIEVLIPGQECSWAGWWGFMGLMESVVKPWTAKVNTKMEEKMWYILSWKVKVQEKHLLKPKAQWLLVQHSCPAWESWSAQSFWKQSFFVRHKGGARTLVDANAILKAHCLFYWSIVDLQVVLVSGVQQINYVYTCNISDSILDSFPHIAISEHWVEFLFIQSLYLLYI